MSGGHQLTDKAANINIRNKDPSVLSTVCIISTYTSCFFLIKKFKCSSYRHWQLRHWLNLPVSKPLAIGYQLSSTVSMTFAYVVSNRTTKFITFCKYQSSLLCNGLFKCELSDLWVKRILLFYQMVYENPVSGCPLCCD